MSVHTFATVGHGLQAALRARAAGRHWLHDLHDPHPARQLCPDRAFRRPPRLHAAVNVAAHLAGPELGGLRYDYRRPKHPYGDKFMLAAGHCAPTCYALWMILGQALYRKYQATGDRRYYVAPDVAMLPVDALGFRRGAGRSRHSWPIRACRIIRCSPRPRDAASAPCPGTSSPPTSPTTSTAARRAWGSRRRRGRPRSGNIVGAPMGTPKIIAFEGEFAMTEGHAQEIKTQAIALQVGKRLRSSCPTTMPASTTRSSAAWCTRSSTATGWSISGPPMGGTCSICPMVTTTTRSWARSRPWRSGTRRIAGP